jgi:hypothetical protein
MDQNESRVEAVNQKEATRAAKKFSRYISDKFFSSNMFLLNRVRNCNDDISSEEHFANLKISRGSYFLL